jgi:PAS domain S-box-containing protein
MIILATSSYAAYLYINQLLTEPAVAVMIIGSLLPLIVGAIIWHTKSNRDEIDDDSKAYKNLADELSEVASKSEVVINAIGDGVIAIDSKGIIKLINPAAQRILGWGKHDAIGLNYKSVMHLINEKNDALDLADDPIQQVLNNNQQVRDNNLALITKNEKRLQISLVVSPVGDIGSGVILVFRDITKEKTEEREQFEFISTASHEMRTPVAAIEGYLGLTLNTATATIDDRARIYLEKAHESIEHLGHLFQDLLDVSKADDGRMKNSPKVIDIVTLTNTIVQELIPKAIKKHVRLIFKPTAGSNRERHLTPVYYVNLDKDHIIEIISNLVENAIKYTPTGEVAIDIIGDNEHVTVCVKDNGIGIPAEDMPHLFQKFYRVDNKDTREIGGTGLGLYICRRLTEIMGGRIWAESIRGKGSTFFLELPRIDNQEASRLMKVEATKDINEAAEKATAAARANTTVSNPIPPKPVQQSSSNVIRTSVLTPEQITAYVAKQRALAAQLASQQKNAIEQQQKIQQQQANQLAQNIQSQIATPQPQPTPMQMTARTQMPSAPSQMTTMTRPQTIAPPITQAVQAPSAPQPQPPVVQVPILPAPQPQQVPAAPVAPAAPERQYFIPMGQIEFTGKPVLRTTTPNRPITMSVPTRETTPGQTTK